MQIYVSKNNQQFGPFDEATLSEMVNRGELSRDDPAIAQGEQEWRKLGNYLTVSNIAPIVAAPITTPKKSRKGLLLGRGGFLLIGVLVAGVLGFLGYRNMSPEDSKENLPDSINTNVYGEFKLKNRYPPKGNIWGTEQNFVGIYENNNKESVIYMMTVYSDEDTATKAMNVELGKTCQTGENPMYFTFKNAKGNELSDGATCALPLYIVKDNKLIVIGGGGAKFGILATFAENLPFNVGSKMTKK